RRVELPDLVGDLRPVGEGDEAVGEHLGDVQSQAVLGREVEREVHQVRGRDLAQVDDHRVDRAGRAAYELPRGGRRQLVVHAAQRAGDVVVGHVRLYDGGLEPVRGELLGSVRAGEEAAVVLAPLELDHPGARDPGLVEDHAPASSASAVTGGCPAAAAATGVRASSQ